jgi:hypothetical protein
LRRHRHLDEAGRVAGQGSSSGVEARSHHQGRGVFPSDGPRNRSIRPQTTVCLLQAGNAVHSVGWMSGAWLLSLPRTRCP